MATRFLGAAFQINRDSGSGLGNGILGEQFNPHVATLSDGRFVVAYQSWFNGDSSDQEAIVAIFNADGSISSPPYLDVFNFAQNQIGPVVAALPGGGFGVAFENDLHADGSTDLNPTNITYVRVSPAGRPGTPLGVGDLNTGTPDDRLFNPAIATLADGRQVVAFEDFANSGMSDDVRLNVVSADGTSTLFPQGAPLGVATTVAGERNPAVAAIGNKALVVYSSDAAGPLQVVGNIFDGTTNSLGAQFAISGAAGGGTPKVAALDDHRYVIIYTDGATVFGRIYDSSGAGSLSPQFNVSTDPRSLLFGLAVTATADGGFIATWTTIHTGAIEHVTARRFNSDGVAMGQQFIVSPLDHTQLSSTVTVSGANAFFGWTDQGPRPTDPSSFGVRGQMMSLTTPPDFNDNGVSDVVWRSEAGDLALWDISRSGAIGGSGAMGFGGVAVTPDASWNIAAESDFSGDGRADLLWRRDDGTLALWTMNGSTVTSTAAPTEGAAAIAPDLSWSVAGAGDFNFDGMSDLLWRNTSSGDLALWTMNGSVITSSSALTSGGAAVRPDSSWSIVGIGDLDGDGKSDVIWRSAAGDVMAWFMDGATITSSADLAAGGTPATPDASWSVAGVGDFNADGSADLLWRRTDGTLSLWLMNGSSIVSSGELTSSGVAVTPNTSWHVVEIGDFNGDARTDILWRNDTGALSEWLMNGTTIVSTVTPTSGGSAIVPDPTWQPQAKPTNFA